MTIPEFIEALRNIPEGRFYLTDLTRLRFRSDVNHCMCPLTTLCYLQTGVFYSLAFWQAAADRIGIGFDDAVKIIRAADGINPFRANGLSQEELELRKGLLTAAGLKEGCL